MATSARAPIAGCELGLIVQLLEEVCASFDSLVRRRDSDNQERVAQPYRLQLAIPPKTTDERAVQRGMAHERQSGHAVGAHRSNGSLDLDRSRLLEAERDRHGVALLERLLQVHQHDVIAAGL